MRGAFPWLFPLCVVLAGCETREKKVADVATVTPVPVERTPAEREAWLRLKLDGLDQIKERPNFSHAFRALMEEVTVGERPVLEEYLSARPVEQRYNAGYSRMARWDFAAGDPFGATAWGRRITGLETEDPALLEQMKVAWDRAEPRDRVRLNAIPRLELKRPDGLGELPRSGTPADGLPAVRLENP